MPSCRLPLVQVLETAERVKKGESVNLPTTVQAAPEQRTVPVAKGKGKGGRGKAGGRPGCGRFTPGLTQATLKPWLAVYEGKSPLFINAASAAGIVHLLKVLQPYKDVRLVLAAPGPVLYETLDHLSGRPIRPMAVKSRSVRTELVCGRSSERT